MSAPRHTPGPWKVCKKFAHQDFYEIEHTLRHTPGAASLVVAKVTCRPSWENEQTANAHLIAQAPNMLKALKLCRFDSLNMNSEDWKFIQDTIAAAEGEA